MFDTSRSAGDLARAAAGDQEAWTRLVRENRGRLHAIAVGFRLSRCDTEDAMQTTWASLVANVGSLRSHDRVGAWLATTMRRNCLRILQGRRYETPVDTLPATVADETRPVDRTLLTAELAASIWHAVGRLPPRQAHLVRALFADGERPYQEIAATLSMPIGAIGPVRRRALQRLAELLDETDIAADDLRLSA